MDPRTLRRILAVRRLRRSWAMGWREPDDGASVAELLREPVARDPSAPRESPARPPRSEPLKGPNAR